MHVKKTHYVLVIFCVFLFAFADAIAAEKATKEECIAKSKELAEIIKNGGVDAGIDKIMENPGPFIWKDSYVFAMDADSGKIIAHPIKPKLVGKNLTGLKDITGKMFFAEFIQVGKGAGEGWVSYMWPKPGEKEPSQKESYVLRVPGTSILLVSGVYPD